MNNEEYKNILIELGINVEELENNIKKKEMEEIDYSTYTLPSDACLTPSISEEEANDEFV